MAQRWYALHTYSGHENKVKTYLESLIESGAANDAIAQVVVPTEEVVELRAGKKTKTRKRFLPSYVLVEMEMSKDAWYQVTNIPGVTNFVGPARKPQPLRQEEIDRILGHVDRRKDQESRRNSLCRRRSGQGQRRRVQGFYRHRTGGAAGEAQAENYGEHLRAWYIGGIGRVAG